MRRSREEALETRRAILREALDCFATRGYALTTFQDIAERIHLTKGAVFWHFKTKEDLLAELLLQMQESFKPLPHVDEAESLEDIRAAFLAWASVLTRNATQRKFMKFVLSRVEWSDALKRTLARKVDAVAQDNPYARLERGLARVRAAGGLVSPLDDTQVAGLLCSVFFGIFREAWLHKTAVPVLPTLEAGLDFILQGIRRQ